MNTKEKLLEKIKSSEDRFVERKLNASKDEVCKTLVAFANSLPENEEGFLFIGIADDGTIRGVDNADKTQKNIRNWAAEVCYPPIKIQSEIVKEGIAEIITIIVYPSDNRPHFAGQAFVRIGSESKKVSAEMFEELITSRNDVGKRLLEAKNNNEPILLELTMNPHLPNERGRFEFFVKECNVRHVIFNGELNKEIAFPLNDLKLSWEPTKNLLLVISPRW